jgi:hypothetical protein
MSDDVFPLGLVRLEGDYNGPRYVPKHFRFELIGMGTGAKPSLASSAGGPRRP